MDSSGYKVEQLDSMKVAYDQRRVYFAVKLNVHGKEFDAVDIAFDTEEEAETFMTPDLLVFVMQLRARRTQ